jgi:hypothetical protein
MNNDNRQSAALTEEIKALLILLLLKGGTPSDEIETALRIASGGEYLPQAAEPDLTCPFVKAKVSAMTPKDRFRNERLAPMKCYAA